MVQHLPAHEAKHILDSADHMGWALCNTITSSVSIWDICVGGGTEDAFTLEFWLVDNIQHQGTELSSGI
jgi:hypothetical protein